MRSIISLRAFKGCARSWTMMVTAFELEIEQYTAFSQSVIQLTKIISDGMTIMNSAPTTVPEL